MKYGYTWNLIQGTLVLGSLPRWGWNTKTQPRQDWIRSDWEIRSTRHTTMSLNDSVTMSWNQREWPKCPPRSR